MLGIPKPFFTLRVATRFCKTLFLFDIIFQKTKKDPEPGTTKSDV